jgi:hypothetical protein
VVTLASTEGRECREINAVCSQHHSKNRLASTICGKNEVYFNVQAGSEFTNHCA